MRLGCFHCRWTCGEPLLAVNLICAAWITFGSLVFAHEGPPYPIATGVKSEFGPLSIWTDPDVGEGTFTFVFDQLDKMPSENEITLNARSATQEILSIKVTPSGSHQFASKVPFSHEGVWNVEFKIGQGAPLILPVEVTPPGPAKWQIWIFLFPFVLVGLLWGKVLWVRRNRWV